MPGAACDRQQLKDRVRAWFDQLPEPATVLYDYAGDWDLLITLILEPPATVGEKIELAGTTIAHPVFEKAAAAAYSDELSPHHALADARALMVGYRAWRAFMEPIWRAKSD